jgi:hypothetical protein
LVVEEQLERLDVVDFDCDEEGVGEEDAGKAEEEAHRVQVSIADGQAEAAVSAAGARHVDVDVWVVLYAGIQ